jgi:gliding motility-associated-like protein
MKKILLFTSIILLAFSIEVYAQHPTNLQATNITASSVDLSWDGTMCNNGFYLRYRDATVTQWTTITTGVTMPYFLFGLSSGTTYEFSVKCIGTSGWASSVLFTTVNDPEIDTAFISQPILCNGGMATDEIQIEITQTTVPTTYSCVIGYYNALGTYFSSYISTNQTSATTINIPGFNPNVDYFVRIVDSTSYYNTHPFGGGTDMTTGIFDEFGPINFSEPAQLVASTSVVASNMCDGDCIAEEDLTISGGTMPYSFDITDINGTTTQNLSNGVSSYSLVALCADNYDVVVTDDNGCSTSPPTTTFVIAPISPIVPAGTVSIFNMNGYNVSCNGANDGSITASASGGTGTFTYSIDGINFQSNALFSGLIAGNYTITYKDANDCIETEQLTLNEPPNLSGTANIIQIVDCFGASTGEITFDVDPLNPGVPPYQYSIDNGSNYQSSNVFSNLSGDITYDVMIEDNNGCQYTSSIYLAEPAQIIYSPVFSNYNGYEITCNGAADGSIDFGIPIGGTAPLEYSIDNGSNYSSASIFTSLVAGSYDLIIRDANLCTEPMTVVLNEPGIFTIPTTVTNPISCFEDCNGTVAINPANAVGQVVYTLDAGAQQTTPSYSGLCGDITHPPPYVIDATDDNGCIAQETVSLSEPTDFVYSTNSGLDYCTQSNGTAEINVTSGGTGGYLYEWNTTPIQNSAIANNLAAGTYSVTVTDANLCQFSESVTVGADQGFTLSFSTVEPCLGINSGSATVSATGMTPYTYVWSDGSGVISGATTATLSNIPVGTYSVVVEDATTCQVTGTVDVNAPVNPIQIDSLIITGNSCFGINDAQIEVLSIGGQSPYSYSNSAGLNTQTNPVFSNLSPGSYTIHAIDANGCYADSTIILSYPGQLVIDSTVFSHISCFGADDGAVYEIQFTGGNAPYEYAIDGGVHQSYMAFQDLIPGWHTVEVFDINNGVNGITCASSDQIYISEPTPLNAFLTPSDWNNYQVLCNGGTSGYLDVFASGGTLPYYTIHMNASPSPDTTFGAISQITGLSQGNHTFTVEDANGCAHTETIMYNEPAPIDISFSPTHVSCVAWSDGAATAIVSGGVGTATSYTYQWSDANGIITGATTYSIDSLSAGSYIIEVTDVHGCINDETVIINDNNALSVSPASVTNAGCYGECDGEITLNVSGGVQFTPPAPTLNTLYNYQWNDYLNQTTNPAVGLCADSVSNTQEYICVITDAQGCELIYTDSITQPEEFSVATEITSVISCNGNSDGKIKASITGGTPMFTYTWGNGSSQNTNNTTNIITGLTEGQYIVDVVDNNGCMASSSIYLYQPDSLQVSINAFDIDCNGAGTGSLSASANGGTPHLGIPPQYEYTWLNESGSIISTDMVDNNVDAEIDSLLPGFYTVKVTDLNGCSVTSEVVSIIEPTTALELIVEAHDEECSTSAFATAFPAGGTGPYTYEWSNGSELPTAADLLAESNTPYTVTVTDNSGCEISENITVLGFQYVLLPNSLNYIDTTICLGQSININIDSLPGLTYSWNDGVLTGDRIISPDTVLAFGQNLSETYILTITDENDCSQDVMVDVISTSSIDAMPASNPGVEYGNYPVVLKGESIEIYSDNNNCQNYTWAWTLDTINEKSTVISPENTSWYYINVEDSEGCLGYDSIYVVVGVKPYEAITPNNDGFNDTWTPLDIESYEESLVQVFNRWGALVFESKGGDSYVAWDGTNKGEELAVGTYYYIINLNTGDEPQTGPITIIR